jgi:hypothetical protein
VLRGVQRGVVADGHQHVLESMTGALVVVDVVGGNDAQAELPGQRHQPLVAGPVAVDKVVLELQPEAAAAEKLQVAAGGPPRPVRVSSGHEPGHLAFPAPGEGDDAFGVAGEGIRIEGRRVAGAVEVGVGEEAAEVGVTLGRLHEQREMGFIHRLRDESRSFAVLEAAGFNPRSRCSYPASQCHLGADDRLHVPLLGRLGELHRPRQPVVVGQRQRRVVEPARLEHQLQRRRCALPEGEAAMAVELDVLTHIAARTSRPG